MFQVQPSIKRSTRMSTSMIVDLDKIHAHLAISHREFVLLSNFVSRAIWYSHAPYFELLSCARIEQLLRVQIQPEGLDFELPGSVHYVTTGAGAHYDTETMLFEQYLGQDIPSRSGCHPKFEKQGNDMGEAICYYYWANQNVCFLCFSHVLSSF